MASSFIDVCRFNPITGGTTDWTYSSAVTGYQNPSAAGAINGATYSYRAESADLTQWEIGTGAYNSGTGVFARTAVLFNSSGTTSKINFSATPQVAIVALAEDLNTLVTSVKKQVFPSNGTYTPSAKMLYCVIECVGGGGGGGGTQAGGGTVWNGGGGGGGGGYSRSFVTAASVGASQTVTVGAGGSAGASGGGAGGAGGSTSVGALCIGNGGSGGGGGTSTTGGGGGAGGLIGTGDLTVTGQRGFPGMFTNFSNSIQGWGGQGGNAALGFGAGASLGVVTSAGSAGLGGSNYGGGGSGSIMGGSGGAGLGGGGGAGGAVVITEYCGTT